MQTINVLTNSKKPSKQLKALINAVDEARTGVNRNKSNAGKNHLNKIWGWYHSNVLAQQKKHLNFEQFCKFQLEQLTF